MRSARLLATALALSLVACGGGGSPQELHTAGLDELSAGEFAAAVATFERALAASDDEQFTLTVQKDLAEAQIHVDADLAAESFLAMHAEHPEALATVDYVNFGRQLKDAGNLDAAIEVVDAGIKRFGETESPKLMETMDQIVQAVAAGGAATTACAAPYCSLPLRRGGRPHPTPVASTRRSRRRRCGRGHR